ncbi:hypothetical protein U8C36_06500 [Sinorhizobium medicae]|nr:MULTISPECIES: hypothetical protein [Sinorhizobium]MDE4557459.1 hypothetical protein [Sinorhizobium meliloti SM11]WQO53261.1 hypothetical protein U8C36_06500 [Sinorhizobium medicae]WQO67323.1 hypothetical protein U8C40_09525 [Sinorhizobium medicae]WQO70853.1 hypothetical protein U8C31_10880 [Sinorhizobium medicae]WQO73958.1 hypothetical protein U8C31_06625 [Sinorhizobium medicae]
MSTHTPGPWTVEPPSEQTPHIWVNAPKSSGVAKIETCNYDDGQGERLIDEDFANARLISAAPDLLDALIMVRDADEDCRQDGLPTIPAPARAKIDRAIAKAEVRS